MKDKGVNLDKIDRMIVLAFENAMRIHMDSIILYKKKRYQSAFFLSILAMEEIGKIFMLEDFLYHSRVDLKDKKQLIDEFSQEVFQNICFHTPKQKQFFNNHILERNHYRKNRYSALYKLIFSNEIEERNRPR